MKMKLAANGAVALSAAFAALSSTTNAQSDAERAYRIGSANSSVEAACVSAGGVVVASASDLARYCVGGHSTPPAGVDFDFATVPSSEAPFAFASYFDGACGAFGGFVAKDDKGKQYCLKKAQTPSSGQN